LDKARPKHRSAGRPGPEWEPLIGRERLIAVGRLALIVAAILLLWLDQWQGPPQLPPGMFVLLPLYSLWALSVAWMAWRMARLSAVTLMVLHSIDVAFFASLVVYTQGLTNGPFFLGLVFLLAVAIVRWGSVGLRWTAAALLAVLAANAAYIAVGTAAPLDLGHLANRVVYLGVITLLLMYYTAHEERLRTRLTGLAVRASVSPTDVQARLGELLGHVAAVLGASRVVVAWSDTEVDRGSIAEWTQGTFQLRGASAEDLASLAPEDLAEAAFLVTPAGAGFRVVSIRVGEGRAQDPLPAWVRAARPACAAISIPLRGVSMTGRLFVLEPEEATTDELLLGKLLGREIVTYMDQLAFFERFHRSGLAEERIRLARDLHDGVIQSLAAAAMRLEATRYLLKRDIDGADRAIDEIQELLKGEQKELRDIIATLQPDRAPRYNAGHLLSQRLESLSVGVAQHWRVAVETDNRVPDAALPHALVREVTWLVREALVNAARHGRARHASVHVALVDGLLHIRVADDGCGFRFRGRVEAAKITEPGLTPFNLGQRVKALGGKLVIDSRDTGATLEMSFPNRAPRTPT
jgi:signal transduction histidine kinase